MLCQRDAYLCSIGDVNVGSAFVQRFAAGLFGGEGIVLQRIVGQVRSFVFCVVTCQ